MQYEPDTLHDEPGQELHSMPLLHTLAHANTPVWGTPRANGTPLLEVEACTSQHIYKRAKHPSPPPHFQPLTALHCQLPRASSETPGRMHAQQIPPRVVEPIRRTFNTPTLPSHCPQGRTHGSLIR